MGSSYPVSVSGWKRASELLCCDAIMSHTRFFMTTPVTAAILRSKQRRISVVDHGAGPLRTSPRMLATISLGYEHAVTALLRLASPQFFAVSEASAVWLRRFGIHNAPVLPNSISPRATAPLRRTRDHNAPITIFSAGRLFADKGILELIAGVELFARNNPEVRLRVAGDGPLREQIESLARRTSWLSYLGRLSPSEVEIELENAHVFIHASRLPEGLPTSLLEAGRAALPVISTPFGGSAELIKDGTTGWIISAAKPSLIASALVEVASSPEESLRRGVELFNLVQSNYTWQSTLSRFLQHSK